MRRRIQKKLQDRWRGEFSESAKQAQHDVNHLVPLQAALDRLHWESDDRRWIYIYEYLRAYYAGDDGDLVLLVAPQEEIYIDTLSKRADEAELALYRKGVPQAERSERIKKFAATQPMNPVENFDPGIHDYSPYQGQPQSVDVDMVGGDFDSEVLTLTYSDGKKLEVPLTAELFRSTPLNPQEALRIFNRRHKGSGRLIPFVIYEKPVDIPGLDLLSEEDLALLGTPRFDRLLTPVVMYFLSPEPAALSSRQLRGKYLFPLRHMGTPLLPPCSDTCDCR